jgi:hypothetical protein
LSQDAKDGSSYREYHKQDMISWTTFPSFRKN